MEKNNSFNQGLITGVAIISTIGFLVLLVYVLTGSNFCLGCDEDSDQGKTAKKFEECLDSGKYDAKIQSDQNLAVQLGVRGTPATFINGYLVSGALPYEALKSVVDDLLAGKEPTQEFLQDEEGNIVKVEMPQITEDDNQTGAKNGKITLLEFSDFECPYCARFIPTVNQIKDAYPNDVTVVFKHFPLSFHPLAKPAAVATECAAEQGKFWEMHDAIFKLNEQQKFTLENIKAAAIEVGLK